MDSLSPPGVCFLRFPSFCYVYGVFVGLLSHTSLVLYNSFHSLTMVFIGFLICLVLLGLFNIKISHIVDTIELIVQLNFQRTPLKEVDSTKEIPIPRTERTSMFTKRSTPAATIHIQHKKPASSVDAQIIGGSTSSSQAVLKQEVSTASSKGSAFKTGMLLCSYNN